MSAPAGGHRIEQRTPLPAGASDWTNTLQTIASRELGEPVTVRWIWSTQLGGQAYRSFGRVIELNHGIALEDLPYVFFHELGHHACGHCNDYDLSAPPDPEQMPAITFLSERQADPEATALLALVEQREHEADVWALCALAEFEAVHGPLLGLLIQN